MNIIDLLALQHVPRWAIVSHARPQSVAGHTFGVMAIAMELADRAEVDMSKSALLYALYHDGPESRTGDIPAIAKRKIQDTCDCTIDPLFDTDDRVATLYSNMTAIERVIVNLADKIEGLVYINKYGIGIHAKKVADLCSKEIGEMAQKEGAEFADMVIGLITELIMEAQR